MFGFRDLGFNIIACVFFTVLIHVAMSYSTLPVSCCFFGPATLLFIPANLENIFSKYAHTKTDKLTFKELWHMTDSSRNAFDFFGWTASKLEWGVLYMLAKDSEGFLSKESVRRCYDGSLFDYCADLQKGAVGKAA
ncbi:putative plant seed peroxygenase [Helianthus anomalus]